MAEAPAVKPSGVGCHSAMLGVRRFADGLRDLNFDSPEKSNKWLLSYSAVDIPNMCFRHGLVLARYDYSDRSLLFESRPEPKQPVRKTPHIR